jgi:hypothetical protein
MKDETSRRHVIAGLAAAPAIALAGIAAAAAASTTLQTLLSAEAALNALDGRIEALWAEIDRAGLAARRALGKHRFPALAWDENPSRRIYLRQRSTDRFNARMARLHAEHGHTAAMSEFKKAEAERTNIETDLWSVPATEPASLIVKARISKGHSHIGRSVINDMLAYFDPKKGGANV